MTRAEYLAGAARLTARRGNQLPHAKLDAATVRAIRANPQGETARQQAERLGVHIRTIEAARSHKTWRHVQ